MTATTASSSKKKRQKIDCTHAKSAMLYMRFAILLAQALQDAGMYSNLRTEEICADRRFIRKMVKVFRRRFLRPTKDPFDMVEEPPGRAFETTHRRGGPFIDMINAQFPGSDKWTLNELPGICGGYLLQHSSDLPENTPLEREFAVWEVLQVIDRAELCTIVRVKGYSQAYFYDLVRVREWKTPFPLFALGSATTEKCNALLHTKKLEFMHRYNRMQPGDRVLVWREKKSVE